MASSYGRLGAFTPAEETSIYGGGPTPGCSHALLWPRLHSLRPEAAPAPPAVGGGGEEGGEEDLGAEQIKRWKRLPGEKAKALEEARLAREAAQEERRRREKGGAKGAAAEPAPGAAQGESGGGGLSGGLSGLACTPASLPHRQPLPTLRTLRPLPPRWPLAGCFVCGEDDDHPELLLCDKCPTIEVHTYCLTPTLPAVPKGAWNCWACTAAAERERREELERRKKRSREIQSSLAAAAASQAAAAASGASAAAPAGDAPEPPPGFVPAGYMAVPKGKRAIACGACTACTADDCRVCVNCLDMIKYGGPGVKHQKCVNRLCQNKIVPAGTSFRLEELAPKLPENANTIDKNLYGTLVWVNPGGCSLDEDATNEPPYPLSFYSQENRPADTPADPLPDSIPASSYLHMGTEPLVPSPSGVLPPWDLPLSWPGVIIPPTSVLMSENLTEVYNRKFPLKHKKGDPPNERYLVKLLGPVLRDRPESEADEGSWQDFIVMRAPDQVWSWKQGIDAGCVKAGLLYSGYTFRNWNWDREVFDAALFEAGYYGDKRQIKWRQEKEVVAGIKADYEEKKKLEMEAKGEGGGGGEDGGG
ncbi:hypothetical protein TeGR_g3975, partial [Tetraparma gracilis]